MNTTIPKSRIAYLGIDLAKHVFYACGMTDAGRVVLENRFTRARLERFTEQLPPCRVGLETCGSAHHWARLLIGQGHDARLISPHFVAPFVKSNKNDARDAEAICEAVSRPTMRFVPVRSESEQAVQQWHRARQRVVRSRTRLVNQLRAFLYEYGQVLPQGVKAFQRQVPDLLEDGENGLLPEVREMLADGYEELLGLDAREEKYRARIQAHAASEEACARLMAIPGVGVLCASALVMKFRDGGDFRNGREAAASVGLVPRQHSTGGQTRLGGISKRGDRYLRTLMIQGASAVVRVAERKEDDRSRWTHDVKRRRHRNSAVVALANKNIRIAWALLRSGEPYREEVSMV